MHAEQAVPMSARPASTRRPVARRPRPAVLRIEVALVELPFRFTFGHALAARSSTLNVVVAAHLSDGSIGYGEGVPREYVTGETPDDAFERIVDGYAPRLLGRDLATGDVAADLRTLRDELHAEGSAPAAAWCAIETALLDALGHALRTPAADLLGGAARRSIRYGGVVPFARGQTLSAFLLACRLYGFADVKLKLGRSVGDDLATVRRARAILGPNTQIRADANCAWDADRSLAMVELLRPYDIRSFEQPVPADDLEGLAQITASGTADVVVDESLCSLGDARALIGARAATVLNIRVSKCGGPLAALEIAALAERSGLACQLGAQVGESGILTAAGRLVATVTRQPFRHHEGADNRFLLRRDLTVEDLTAGFGGWASAAPGPGLGVHVRPDALAGLAQRRASLGRAPSVRVSH